MPNSADQRRELMDEYRVWANICKDKHGLPWPLAEDALDKALDSEILAEIKKMKVIARTPHD